MTKRLRFSVIAALLGCVAMLITVPSHGTSVKKMNVGDLTALGSDIVFATVTQMVDGVDPSTNLPYTMIMLDISESLKGSLSGTYAIRQFGLMAPKDLGNGKTSLMVSPDGFPEFEVGSEVLLFLYPTTSLGFQSTVGLMQGKFDIHNDEVINAIDNEGLFANLSIDLDQLSERERKMVERDRGAVDKSTFKSFVGKAVQNGWFE